MGALAIPHWPRRANGMGLGPVRLHFGLRCSNGVFHEKHNRYARRTDHQRRTVPQDAYGGDAGTADARRA